MGTSQNGLTLQTERTIWYSTYSKYKDTQSTLVTKDDLCRRQKWERNKCVPSFPYAQQTSWQEIVLGGMVLNPISAFPSSLFLSPSLFLSLSLPLTLSFCLIWVPRARPTLFIWKTGSCLLAKRCKETCSSLSTLFFSSVGSFSNPSITMTHFDAHPSTDPVCTWSKNDHLSLMAFVFTLQSQQSLSRKWDATFRKGNWSFCV